MNKIRSVDSFYLVASGIGVVGVILTILAYLNSPTLPLIPTTEASVTGSPSSTPTPTLTHTPTPTPTPTLTHTPMLTVTTSTLEPITGIVIPASLNIREYPNLQTGIVATVRQGDEIEILGRNSALNLEWSWLKIILSNDRQGWVRTRYIEIAGLLTDIPITLPGPPPPTTLSPSQPPPLTRPQPPLTSPTLEGKCIGLLFPTSSGDVVRGLVEFEWQWLCDDLSPEFGFELRIWREGEKPFSGTHDALEANQSGLIEQMDNNIYHLDFNVINAPGVRNRGGVYLWSINLIRLEPEYDDLDLKVISEPKSFFFIP